MTNNPVCGNAPVLPDQPNISLNLNYLFNAATAQQRGEPLFLGVDRIWEIMETQQKEKPLQAAPETRKSGVSLSMELEGQVQDISNLVNALDLIVDDIFRAHTQEPTSERTRSALFAVHESLCSQVRKAEEFVQTNYRSFRCDCTGQGEVT